MGKKKSPEPEKLAKCVERTLENSGMISEVSGKRFV